MSLFVFHMNETNSESEMNVLEKKTKQNLLVTIVGVSLFAAFMNFSVIVRFLGGIIDVLLPIIAGSILALFLNVPMTGIKNRLKKLFGKSKKQPSDKAIHLISFFITIICIMIVLAGVSGLLVPELVNSARNLYVQINEKLPQWMNYFEGEPFGVEWVEAFISEIDVEKMLQNITNGMDFLLPNVASALSSTIGVVVTAAFAIIISIYMTLGIDKIGNHCKKLICAYLKPAWANHTLHFCSMFHKSFAKFLSGQCTEAVILGILMFLAFTIVQLPYANLVGVLTAVCAIIPYVGAFISCSVSIFLTTLLDPGLAIRCAIVYLAVQFIENQFIYPKVVGESVGLSPFYTLIAAMIGGKLFGIMGIIFFIPLTSVILELVKEDANRRLQKQKNVE
ncbi:MAG: AI-2E family transporter [bacterium]|nr:AI-2E family transporter [bacterium]